LFQPEARAAILQQLRLTRSVDKMTKFFGEDPTLIRQFLSNLGYDQYAGLFEETGVGIQELGVLTEEQLRDMGVPQGAAWRILDCSKRCDSAEEFYE
jgi:hypothetical protein